ncbi:MAG: hypothetical protein K0R24_856 [Gammaproteobacteria bacterium]|jgi:hypothetical protein|nr:hypothetical protein [Gammaproteobacteria bacterium]
MEFNPFFYFTDSQTLYKDNFLIWAVIVWGSLTGSFEVMGFLDYLFVVPFLIKHACILDSPFKKLLYGISNFLSIFKHITALALTIISVPLSYAVYKYVGYKGRLLEKDILEVEVLPVDEEKLAQLDYSNDEIHRSINKNKLTQMFYEDNSGNRVKLKNHPKINELQGHRMEKYMLSIIELKDEKNFFGGEKIFGLFPCLACYCGLSSSGHEPSIEGLPVALIVPSKDNKKELLAMQKMDAFFFSAVWDREGFLPARIENYIQRDDVLKEHQKLKIKHRRAIQFSLQQASKTAVNNTAQAETVHQIDPLIAEVISLAGFGNSTREDTTFLGTFRNSIFYNPANPWIHKLPGTYDYDSEEKENIDFNC